MLKEIKSLKELEKEAIEQALLAFGMNLTQAAVALGIARASLYRKMKAYGITRQSVAALQLDKPKTFSNESPKTELAGGSPCLDGAHLELKDNGQQKDYVVLTKEERAKGFVRPVRTTYKHLNCGQTTTMGISIAETYARDPKFYSGTFCTTCSQHRPLREFVWEHTEEMVGS